MNQTPENRSDAAARRPFPWGRVAAGAAVLAVVGAIPGMWWGARYKVYGRAASRAEAERAEACREGMPLTIAELRAGLPKVAPADNAAPLYRSLLPNAGKVPPADDTAVTKWWPTRTGKDENAPLPPAPPEVRAGIAALAPRLAVAETASRLPGCDWDRRWEMGPAVLFPELALGRSLARQFSARAVLRAQDGDTAGAFADVETTARMSRHMGTDPNLIGLLVQAACGAIADRTFVQVTLTRLEDPRTVALARQADATFRPLVPADFVRALDGDAAIFGEAVAYYRRDPKGFERNYLGVLVSVVNGRPYHMLPAGPTVMIADAWEANGLGRLRATRAALRTPPDDAIAAYRATVAVAGPELGEPGKARPGEELPSLLLSSYGQAYRRMVNDLARQRLRRTLIALIVARQAAGTKTWPASLPPTSTSDAAERTDPYTDKPFSYRVTDGGKGFLLYSVGDNGKDDGGEAGMKPGGSGELRDDIAIRYP